MNDFLKLGLKRLWIHFGKGNKACYIPIHHIFNKMGYLFCRSLLKSHIGTGCDYLSKVGTKESAPVAEPDSKLKKFGEAVSLIEKQVTEAELYLVDVNQGV